MGNPEKIGDIHPFAELFKGATTTVYKGFQKSLDRYVLLKVLNKEFSDDPEIAHRFEDEAKLAAKVQHPNVVSIYSYGREAEQTYIATEFIEGTTLADLAKKQQLPPSLASYVLLESARALKAAHEKGILHRDIKPSNILISNDGLVKVADFGMASIFKDENENGPVRGTMAYIAPELILGSAPSPSSDLFSLGATFFEALLGEPAFKGPSNKQYMDQIVNRDPTSKLQDEEEIDTQLRRICQQLLRKKAQQRYQNCSVLLSDLEGYRRTRGSDVIGNASEMVRFLNDPESYKSPARDKTITVRARSTQATKESSTQANVRERKPRRSKEGEKQPNMARIFAVVGVLVLLFAGLSLAGNFFFSKDGKWGGTNSPNVATPSSSGSGRTVTARRGNASQGPAVSANTEENRPGSEVDQVVNQDVDPVEVIDKSNPEEEAVAADTSTLSLTAIPDVDTVVILPDQQDVELGQVNIEVSPWAVVYFDGDSVGTTPLPPITARPGTYQIELKNPDFPDFKTLVDVLPGRETPIEISLWTFVGRLEVEVYPYAKVYINDVLIDETPLDGPITVEPGSHLLTLEHPTLGVFESTFSIAAGESRTLQFNLNEMR